eukprot:SAG11_NODE_2523_length_3260_cov_5.031003_1_plen_253_part_00
MSSLTAAPRRTNVLLCVGGIMGHGKADAIGMRLGKNLGLPAYQDDTFAKLLQDEWLQSTATVESLLIVLRERCTGAARMRSLADVNNVVIYMDVPEEETIRQNGALARGRRYGEDTNDISIEYLRLLRAAYATFMQEVAAATPGRIIVKIAPEALLSVSAPDLADAISSKIKLSSQCRAANKCLTACENPGLECNCRQTQFKGTNLDSVIGSVAQLELARSCAGQPVAGGSPPSSPPSSIIRGMEPGNILVL